MGTFVGNNTLQVHHVAHNAVLAGYAHAPQHLAGIAGYVSGNLATVTLGHTNLLWCGLALIHQYTQTPNQQLALSYFGYHLRQFFLLQLKAAYRPAKLHTLLTVTQGSVIAIHSRTQRAPGNAITRLGKAA